jgi:hypothetical protein
MFWISAPLLLNGQTLHSVEMGLWWPSIAAAKCFQASKSVEPSLHLSLENMTDYSDLLSYENRFVDYGPFDNSPQLYTPPVRATRNFICPENKTFTDRRLDKTLTATNFHMLHDYTFGQKLGEHVVYHEGTVKVLCFLAVFCVSKVAVDAQGQGPYDNLNYGPGTAVLVKQEFYLPMTVRAPETDQEIK